MRKLIAMLFVVCGFAVWAGQAAACDPGWSRNNNGKGEYFLGADDPGAPVVNCLDGTSASIYINNPSVNSNEPSGQSSSWSGIYDMYNGNSNPSQYVLFQFGYLKIGTGQRGNFWQTNVDGSQVSGGSGTFSPPTAGTTQIYKEWYSGSAAHFTYNGTDYQDYGYILHGINNNTCFVSTVRSETQDSSIQTDGTVNNPENFGGLQVRHQSSGNWDSSDSGWGLTAYNWPTTPDFPVAGGTQLHGNPNGIFFQGPVVKGNGVVYVQTYDTCKTTTGN